MPALSYYIRSARCWDVSPLRFTGLNGFKSCFFLNNFNSISDTRSCGGTLPVREFNATGASAGYKFTGPIRRYGINHVCLYPESMMLVIATSNFYILLKITLISYLFRGGGGGGRDSKTEVL